MPQYSDCSCTYEFERPDTVFYSGEIINGRVVLDTTKVFNLSELTIQCDGFGEVSWEEEVEEKDKGKYTKIYYSRETYVESLIVLRSRLKLLPGRTIYDFSIQLPEDCASSFKRDYGHVSYVLTLRWKPFSIYFEQPITVLEKVDLNSDPRNAIAIKDEEVKYFCCWCCWSGPVLFTLTLPYSGYVPGQKINYQLEIDNQSEYDVFGYTAELVQYSNFHASHPEPQSRETVVSVACQENDECCRRLSKRIFEFELAVPFKPPTSKAKHIISIRYYFRITLKTGGCHFDTEIKVPIAIGTIPLMESLVAEEDENVTENYGNGEEHDSNQDVEDRWVDCNDDEDGADMDGVNIEVCETDPLNSPQPEPSAPEYNEVADNPPSYENYIPPPTFEQAISEVACLLNEPTLKK